VCGVEDDTIAIQNLVQASLGSIIGEMDLDDALSFWDEIEGSNVSADVTRGAPAGKG